MYTVNNIIQWIMLFENYIVFSKWKIFFRSNIVAEINDSWSHQVLSERNAAFLKNANVYAHFILSLKEMLPLSRRCSLTYMEDRTHLFQSDAYLRVLLYTFSKECCTLCTRMLHIGMPQLPQEMQHSFNISRITYEKHAVTLRIWVDAVLGFNNTTFFKGTICLPLQDIAYLFM